MKGVCNCGAVAFSISGKMPGLYQCHCSLCRKQSGTASNAATIVPVEKFSWVSGEDAITQWKKESGFSSYFCQTCGSPVPNPLRTTGYMWVPAGLLEETSAEIVAHLWCSSGASWDKADDSSRQYGGMPDDLDEFISFLHKQED